MRRHVTASYTHQLESASSSPRATLSGHTAHAQDYMTSQPPPPPPLSYHSNHYESPNSGQGYGFCAYGHGGAGGGSAGHFSDSHISTNVTPSHTGIFPAMNVNVSMNMNVHGVTASLPQGLYDAQPDTWSTRFAPPHQSGFYGTPLTGGGDYLSHHHGVTHPVYPGYPPTPHGYGTLYDTESSRLAASFDRNAFYKSSATESVSRLYSLSAMTSRRGHHGRHLTSQYDMNSKPNICPQCGKNYARPSTLKTHMRTHSGEKPFRCKICAKCFSQAANLTAHMRTHTGDKPFECKQCQRRFSQSSSVTTHMRTHTKDRPYCCEHCKKRFADSSTLTKHRRTHTGDKPYRCKLCLLSFSQSGNLNRHMRTHENMINK